MEAVSLRIYSDRLGLFNMIYRDVPYRTTASVV
jgi:hypothetical protein